MKAARKFLCASLLSLASCQAHQPSTNSRPQVDAIKARYTAWKHAFEMRDLDGIMAIYAPDVDAYDVVPPLQFYGADAYRKDYASFLSQFKGPVRVNDPNIHIEQSGNIAFAFGLERLRGTTTDGRPVDLWVRFTDGWQRRNGQWLVVHEHVSVPVDLATGKAKLDLTP
jgi:ketosteroid isomerase-like protein